MIIDYEVKGIPCQIRVDHYEKVKPWKGSPHNCPSDADFYGYEDIEYTVLDRKGYEATWLEKKIDVEEDEKIQFMISDYYNTDHGDYDEYECDRDF